MFEYMADQKENFSSKPFTPADAAILSTVANINFSYYYKRHNKDKVLLGQLARDFIRGSKPKNSSGL